MEQIHKNITGAEALLISLLAEGVDTLFGYPGGAIIPVYDTLYNYRDRFNHILTRHEQGAVHAAQGFARATGKVGVCMATSGPGATNLITGIADAMTDSTPLVCITAQVAASLLGSDAFQEADIISMTIPITKWNYQITDPSEIGPAIAKAFYIAANGRPGPVVIDFAKNAQIQTIDEFKYEKCLGLRSYNPIPKLCNDKINKISELINSSKKPLLIVGNGVKISEAEKAVIELAEKCSIPMATTLMGISAIPSDHPLYIGNLGMHGNVAPNIMTQESDLIIAVGMRFSDRVTGDLNHYAPKAKIVHIDIDNTEIGKIVNPYIGLAADAKQAIEAIIPKANKVSSRDEWMQLYKQGYDEEFEKVIDGAINPKHGNIRMGEVVSLISKTVKNEAIIVTDVGQQQMFGARYSKFNHSRSFITSGGLGTMGFGLPASIGAKVGVGDTKTVIALLGDGGIQMTIQELGTIAQSEIGVKVVVLNNNFLGMVRQWQQLFFDKRYSFTELTNPDFAKVGEAYGIKSRRVTDRESLQYALDEMLANDDSYLLEVVVESEENVFPMIPAGAPLSKICFNE